MPIYLPSVSAQHRRRIGFSPFGEAIFGPVIYVKVAFVKSVVLAEPTPIRSGASASRGAADDMIAKETKVLFPAGYIVAVDDMVMMNDVHFRVASIFPRLDLFGRPDHVEVTMRTVEV